MRLSLDRQGFEGFDYQSAIAASELTTDEKKQLSQLFKKLVDKGHLGTSGSSQLELLIRKINRPELALIRGEEDSHHYILKVCKVGEMIETTLPSRNDHPAGKTLLQLAINAYKPNEPATFEAIQRLVDNPAIDINQTDAQGWTAAYQATQVTDRSVLELIFNHPSIRLNAKNVDRSAPLIRAADRNNIAAVELLLAKGVKVDAVNVAGTALSYAARKGHADVIRLLLTHGANPNLVRDSLGKSPLTLAMEGGHQAAVELLREAGGREEVEPSELHKKIRAGGEELRTYLAEDVNRVDQYGRTAAHYWAYEPAEETRQILVDLGARFDHQDYLERTPLHYAASQGHDDAVAFLLDQPGVDVNASDDQRYSPLFYAAQYNRESVARLLIAKGAHIDHRDKFDWTPLDKAAESNSENVCRLLCNSVDHEGKKIVNINRQAKDGRTALHKAALNGSEACVSILLSAGADRSIPGEAGKLAIQYAEKHPHIQALLQ